MSKELSIYLQLCQELANELVALNLGFSPNLSCGLADYSVVIGLRKDDGDICQYVFASQIAVTIPRLKITDWKTYTLPEINFGSSGSFSPENAAPYWRTIHAAIILQNWHTMLSIFERYCKRYREEIIGSETVETI